MILKLQLASESSTRLVDRQIAESYPQESWWNLEICISNRFSDEADCTGLGPLRATVLAFGSSYISMAATFLVEISLRTLFSSSLGSLHKTYPGRTIWSPCNEKLNFW